MKHRCRVVEKNSRAIRLAFLILAHNEAEVIGGTVASVVAQLSPRDDLFVVADNCTDATAKIAGKAGAKVLIRKSGNAQGKAEALAWFYENHAALTGKSHFVVILDADSRIGENFCREIRNHPHKNNSASQCFVQPLYEESPIGRLAALSELIDQKLSDRWRSALGWPVRLRGTGMVISPENLGRVAPLLKTEVEDIALTLLLVAHGIPIHRIESAPVYDKKPMTRAFATQQRARWYRGQWLCLWAYRREVFRVLLKGPAGWALLSSLFLRPKWLIGLFLLLLALVLSGFPLPALVFGILLLLNVGYLILGLLILPERKVYLRALLYSPVFIWMWLQSILLAFRPSGWRRAR
jgi:cellulose synthase/poly-beta-1,6-N-acetylglucosamine synthase-like glycosyltransferase